jgi:hypothetical protein
MQPKVYISLTTIPERLHFHDQFNNVKICIDSLLALNYSNYEIHFNIPFLNKKTGNKYIIPEWLQQISSKQEKLKIFRTDDFGPPTKIAPTLERVTDNQAFIIILDDDFAYHPNIIKNHLEAHERNENAAIGYAGLGTKDPEIYYCTCVEKDTEVCILEAYKSCSYKRHYFKEDFFSEFLPLSWNDDVMIAAYLGKYSIKKIVARYNEQINFNTSAICLPLISSILNYKIGENIGCDRFRNDNQETSLIHFMSKGYLKYPIP